MGVGGYAVGGCDCGRLHVDGGVCGWVLVDAVGAGNCVFVGVGWGLGSCSGGWGLVR